MAETNDLLVAILHQSTQMMQMTIADMSDAELMMRPATGANTPNWQLGHVLVAENRMLTGCGATMPKEPEGAFDKYNKAASTSDDAAAFLKKEELVAWLTATRVAATAFAKGASAEVLASPAPEGMRKMAPTVRDVIALTPLHWMMHMGQIQVLRRHTNKPILF